MRPEGSLLAGETDLVERLIQPLLKDQQPFHVAVHPEPEDTGPVRIGEDTGASDRK